MQRRCCCPPDSWRQRCATDLLPRSTMLPVEGSARQPRRPHSSRQARSAGRQWLRSRKYCVSAAHLVVGRPYQSVAARRWSGCRARRYSPYDQYITCNMSSRNLLMHTIEAPNKGGFAASRRANERSDGEGLNIQGDIMQRLVLPIPCIELPHIDCHLFLGTSLPSANVNVAFDLPACFEAASSPTHCQRCQDDQQYQHK